MTTTRRRALDSGVFAGVRGVARVAGPERERWDTTYYDTDDLRLARAGIVAVRPTGADARWRVVLPGGRPDVRLPGAPDQVPAELADLVRAYTGNRPLGPCARTSTERDRWRVFDHAGGVLADVTDDRVHASLPSVGARTWHAVAVEGRSRSAVADRLAERGLSPTRHDPLVAELGGGTARPKPGRKSAAGAVVAAYVREQLDRLRAADLAVRLAEPSGVHDLRVAVRRLRSALRVFRRVVGPPRAAALDGELAWLSDLLGTVRDAEALEASLRARLAEVPRDLVLGPVSAELDRRLSRRHADGRAALLAAMTDRRYTDLLADLDAAGAPRTRGVAGRPAKDVLPPLVAKAYRRTRRAVATAERATAGRERDAALHRVRKAVKRLRYASEAAAPAVGRKADRYARRCREVQSALGEHHDLVTARVALREFGVQAHLDGANAFTFGLLHGTAGAETGRWESEFARRWPAVARARSRRWLR